MYRFLIFLHLMCFCTDSVLATETKIILPLYSWAGDPEWTTVSSSVAEYPGIQFLIIINPSSGPGSSNPDSEWTTAVEHLKNNSNVEVIGYIHTSYGQRDTSELESEVSQYAAWPPEARVSGIFFDEV